MIAPEETETLSQAELLKLLEAFKAGDNAAGWRIVLSMHGWMVTLITRSIKGELVEDIASELGLVLFRSLKRYDPAKASLSHYVHTIWTRRAGALMQPYLGKIKTMPIQHAQEHEASEPPQHECKVVRTLDEMSSVDEPEKYIYRLRANGYSTKRIMHALKYEFPECHAKILELTTSVETTQNLLIDIANRVAQQVGAELDLDAAERLPERILRAMEPEKLYTAGELAEAVGVSTERSQRALRVLRLHREVRTVKEGPGNRRLYGSMESLS